MSEDFWRKRAERGPNHCQWCEHWAGPADPRDPDGNVWCPANGTVNAMPANGCSSWARATGLDRDDIPPKLPWVDQFKIKVHVDEDAWMDAFLQSRGGTSL